MELSTTFAQPLRTAGWKATRASQACLACRTRKTRCELNQERGEKKPPCRRCSEECIECVLTPSRRGGRRSRKPVLQSTLQYGEPVEYSQPWDRIPSFQQASPRGGWTATGREYGPSPQRSEGDIESHITSTDLLNPSDALDVLAQVAGLDHRSVGGGEGAGGEGQAYEAQPSSNSVPTPDDFAAFDYLPISAGVLTASDAFAFIKYYHEQYHPFFPVAHHAVFLEREILVLAKKEPYLLTAILTISTKDDPSHAKTHQFCASFMEGLISKLIFDKLAGVGAVEALLIMAEWAPQRPEANIGCGEEDQGAWMYVGIAIRLGYLQKLELTGLTLGRDGDSEENHRKRLAWAACYLSDRQVSIRLGKGFWSRGHGPSICLKASDFPSLSRQTAGTDNLGLVFQAHLELNQVFGTAHDILYSSSYHREHLYLGGEYCRFIDDCASTLRKWKLVWGGLSFTPPIKAALFLTYDFLRLYVNAFAFQATLNRAIARARSSPKPVSNVLRLTDLAEEFDARFIYESIDAANSLLGTLNSFIDPTESLKFMPIKYFLYIIYAAVFLFKARLTGALGNEASLSVHRTIKATITRLQKTSPDPDSLGHRYARSLYLLWQDSLESPDGPLARHENPNGKEGAPLENRTQASLTVGHDGGDTLDNIPELNLLGGFSWKDLDSLGQFISSDNPGSSSVLLGSGFGLRQDGNEAANSISASGVTGMFQFSGDHLDF